MRLILLTSNQLRHKHMASVLAENHELVAVFAEAKEDNVSFGDSYDQISWHFAKRAEKEREFFGHCAEWPSGTAVHDLRRGQVNDPGMIEEIRGLAPRGVAVFGCGIIKSELLSACPQWVINAHQGLSPYYRGSGTNFWPLYDGKPEYVGVTIHYVDQGIDTGGIICHGRPEISADDGMHDIGCKTIQISACLLSKVFALLEQGVSLIGIPQWEKGILRQRKDFTREAAEKLYRAFDAGLVRDYLDRTGRGRGPVRLVTLETGG